MKLRLDQLYALPDHWLRAIDFGVGLLSAYAAWAHHSMAWAAWSVLAFGMCATNATARLQAAMRALSRRVALAVALRSF